MSKGLEQRTVGQMTEAIEGRGNRGSCSADLRGIICISSTLVTQLSRKKKKKEKPRFIAFADFHGISILIMAKFMLPRIMNWLTELLT